ncbi:AAA family ATPase [Sulfurimonas sp. SAG-AH-194-I05]|nr:AAA family ATPase [Sulfurimonas sp. SAG-AH-194-I05]MDF1876010.1 AAA family ATPase [Sulfurimonas sp. SAG-AH-194-I05]
MKNLIIIAGVAGSGKSYIGKEIAKKINNCVYLDKDTQTRELVDSYLFCLGHSDTDRESKEYLEKIRPLEYSCLMKQSLENLELGKSCILSAPFIKEINDKDFFEDLSVDLEFEDAGMKFIWINTDENTARKRIIDRNAKRDENKINNWTEYIQKTSHQIPTLDIDFFTIDNRIDPDENVVSQIENAIAFITKD